MLSSFDELTAIGYSTSCAADINNDGDMELLVLGGTSGSQSAVLYEISSGALGISSTYNISNLTRVYDETVNPSCAFGDYTNDGKLDLVVSGFTSSSTILTRLYFNNGTAFISDGNATAGITSLFQGGTLFFDIDNDGDLDLVTTGASTYDEFDGAGTPLTYIYNNSISRHHPNSAPAAPTSGFVNDTNGSVMKFAWGNGSDDLTPSGALYYNIQIGTNPCSSDSGCNDIVSGVYGGSSNPWKGYFGNMMQRKSINLTIPERTYYWRVQAIDTGFRASSWSTQQTYEPDDCTIGEGEDWNITSACSYSDTTINFPNGKKIIINNGASLTLSNVFLNFSSLTNGTTGIEVEGGTLTISGGSLINATNNTFYIKVSSGTLSAQNSFFTRVGSSAAYPGIAFNGSSLTFKNNTVVDSYAGFTFGNGSNKKIYGNSLSGIYGVQFFGSNHSIFWGTLQGTTASVKVNANNHTTFNVTVGTIDVTSGALFVKWMIMVNTSNSTQTVNASVFAYDKNGQLVEYFQNSNGLLRLNLTEYYYDGAYTTYTNYSIVVEKPYYTTINQSHNATAPVQLNFTLQLSGEPTWDNFKNSVTTNFTTVNDYSSVSGITIGKSAWGIIRFKTALNVTSQNLDRYIQVENNRISVYSNESARFNVTANITFYNLSYVKNPVLLSDGVYCSTCNLSSYGSGEANFSVPHFSAYNTSANSKLSVTSWD